MMKTKLADQTGGIGDETEEEEEKEHEERNHSHAICIRRSITEKKRTQLK